MAAVGPLGAGRDGRCRLRITFRKSGRISEISASPPTADKYPTSRHFSFMPIETSPLLNGLKLHSRYKVWAKRRGRCGIGRGKLWGYNVAMTSYQANFRKDTRTQFERIVLVLQGGGALGSYQAGVYQALAEADLQPIGSREFQSARSIPQSSPAIPLISVWIDFANSGRPSARRL